MKNIKILLIILGFQMSAWADSELLTIEGTTDCASWVLGRTTDRSAAYEHYVIGLLNGMVVGSKMAFWRAKGSKLTQGQVFLWMDNYCSKNPLSGPFEGAIELMSEQTSGRFAKRPW